MSDFLYEVVFYGQIHEDAELDAVKASIAKMFKTDQATTKYLFSGKRIVIKKNLSAEAADKYSMAFAKAGAICELAPIPADSASPVQARDRAAAKAPSAAPDAADKGASSKRRLRKIAAISAVAVAVAVALAAATLFR